MAVRFLNPSKKAMDMAAWFINPNPNKALPNGNVSGYRVMGILGLGLKLGRQAYKAKNLAKKQAKRRKNIEANRPPSARRDRKNISREMRLADEKRRSRNRIKIGIPAATAVGYLSYKASQAGQEEERANITEAIERHRRENPEPPLEPRGFRNGGKVTKWESRWQ